MSPFTSIVCGVDGSARSTLAVAHAAVLASRGARLELVGVCNARTNLVEIALGRARRGLRNARTHVLHHPRPAPLLLSIARRADLLAVGAPTSWAKNGSPSVAAAVLRDAPCSVLLARPTHAGGLLDRVLIVADHSRATVEAAAVLLTGHPAARPILVDVASRDGDDRGGLARHAARLRETCGGRRTLVTHAPPTHDAITRIARAADATLVVIGACHGGLGELVARDTPCSVLVVRPWRGR